MAYGGKSEMIILNDTPGQILTCHVPDVTVVNVPLRFRTLGEKRNALVGMAKYDLLCVWDDDDISLPNRLSQACEKLKGIRYGYYTVGNYWFMDGDRLTLPSNVGYCHNCSTFTRDAFDIVGGYNLVSGYEDREIAYALNHNEKIVTIVGGNLDYIYRWGVSPCHLSGKAELDQHYLDIGQKHIIPGCFNIVPKWRRDYNEMTKAFTNAA